MSVRTRFAPSPTGNLHIGGARTALFNWLWAKKWNGKFVLRIEDTDRDRSSPEFEESIKRDLKWLGLEWDEGPDVGGAHLPYRQSERLSLYLEILKKLKETDYVYPCYCTPEELEAERKEQLSRGMPPRYSGKCRNLTEEDRKILEREGRVPSWRFKVPQRDGRIEFHDEVHGTYALSYSEVGDFIVMRSDGIPTYLFAAVVDDHFMEITHVIRGDEHLPNTTRQLLLFKALSWQPPSFAHIPMILSREGRKLSKREGAESIDDLRQRGYLPEAVRAYLATLSWAVEGEDFLFDLNEMAKRFELSSISRSSPIHDEERLRWWGSEAIKRKDLKWLADVIVKMTSEGGLPVRITTEELAMLLPEALSGQATIVELLESLNWLFHRPQVHEAVPPWMRDLKAELSKLDDWNKAKIEDKLRAFQKRLGLKAREFFHPLRIFVTGRISGPPLPLIMEVLGKEEIISRLVD
ncbi:glutamate--tRNA ligase [Acetomicrobium hydrogeniformans]|uniref:Glutamate--tRNA ligase n=1 Tax=Acetomicrobium hydrogeniformans TaxID=649746 RepID=A0A7V6ZF80_9BACT|nr:glutamate--tRNA ligase [Acetomicrobium hydrogeniformans]HHZ04837.1 glutamate--tRNA ligase [Acetomicrobium hydrogeniformans]